MTVFINYTVEDETLAQRLYADFLTGGVRPWMAYYDSAPGDDEIAAETAAMQASDIMVLILTKKYLRNPLAVELTTAAQAANKTIIPVIADMNVRVPDGLPEGVKLKKRYGAAVEELIAQLPHDAEPLDDVPPYQQGNAAYHEGEYDEALKAYQKVTEETAEILNSTAAAHNALRQHAEALELLNRAVELDGNNVKIYLNRSLALSALGQHEESLADDKKIIELEPDKPRSWSSHGMTLYGVERYDEAATAIRKAIELNPDEAHYLYQLSLILLKQEQYDAAIATLDEALNLEPDDLDIMSMRQIALGRAGRIEEALAEIDHQIKKNPRHGGNYVTRSLVNFYLERYDKTVEDATMAIKRGQNAQPAPYFNRAIAHWKLGNAEAAQNDLLQAINFYADLATESGIRNSAESDLTREPALEILKALEENGQLTEPE